MGPTRFRWWQLCSPRLRQECAAYSGDTFCICCYPGRPGHHWGHCKSWWWSCLTLVVEFRASLTDGLWPGVVPLVKAMLKQLQATILPDEWYAKWGMPSNGGDSWVWRELFLTNWRATVMLFSLDVAIDKVTMQHWSSVHDWSWKFRKQISSRVSSQTVASRLKSCMGRRFHDQFFECDAGRHRCHVVGWFCWHLLWPLMSYTNSRWVTLLGR